MNSVEHRLARIATERRRAVKDVLLKLLGFALAIFCVVMSVFWYDNFAKAVVSTEDAGALLEATFNEGFTQTTTTVRTSHGTFLVHGTFQTLAGHAAEIRTYRNGDRRLCDRAEDSCQRLVK